MNKSPLNASDREKGNAVNYLHVTGEGHCLRCHQDYMSGHLDHKCPKEGMLASVCNEKCDPRWNIKGVNDIPPSSDSWDIRTEINTRLWYAHGAITPTSEEMERMVTSMEALFLSQEVRIKKVIEEEIRKAMIKVVNTPVTISLQKEGETRDAWTVLVKLRDDLLTYLK